MGLDRCGIAGMVLLVGLGGCSAGPNVREGYSLAKAGGDGKGVLVLSLSTDNPDNAFIPQLTFNYGTMPHGEKDEITLRGPGGCDKDKPEASDFGATCGRLFVVELPAGDYYLYPWALTLFPPIRQCTPLGWEPIRFSIIAGKGTYVGEFRTQLGDAGQTSIGMTKFGSAWVVSSDAHKRDFALLAQRYPDIGADAMQVVPAAFPVKTVGNAPKDSNCGGAGG